MSPLNITQPWGISSTIAIQRWCPIAPKWDIYQSLKNHDQISCHLFPHPGLRLGELQALGLEAQRRMSLRRRQRGREVAGADEFGLLRQGGFQLLQLGTV